MKMFWRIWFYFDLIQIWTYLFLRAALLKEFVHLMSHNDKKQAFLWYFNKVSIKYRPEIKDFLFLANIWILFIQLSISIEFKRRYSSLVCFDWTCFWAQVLWLILTFKFFSFSVGMELDSQARSLFVKLWWFHWSNCEEIEE